MELTPLPEGIGPQPIAETDSPLTLIDVVGDITRAGPGVTDEMASHMNRVDFPDCSSAELLPIEGADPSAIVAALDRCRQANKWPDWWGWWITQTHVVCGGINPDRLVEAITTALSLTSWKQTLANVLGEIYCRKHGRMVFQSDREMDGRCSVDSGEEVTCPQ